LGVFARITCPLRRDDPSACYVVQSDLQQSTKIPRQVPNEVHVMGAGRYDSFDSGAVLHEKQAMRHPLLTQMLCSHYLTSRGLFVRLQWISGAETV
jgi:hypothetical protein